MDSIRSRPSPYQPIKIILRYEDNCVICQEKMKRFSDAFWRGNGFGVMHLQCYESLQNTPISLLLDW
jgi:hypothetical protein